MFLRKVDIPKECRECYSTNFKLINECEKAICPLSNYRRLIRRYRKVLAELEIEKRAVIKEISNITKEIRR